MNIKSTATISLDDALSQICAEHGEQSASVILDALKRQDDFCTSGAYSNGIYKWVEDNPKEKEQ